MKKFLLLLVLLAAGCAYNTRVDYAPVPVPPGAGERLVILPFSSYEVKDPLLWERINIAFYEALKSKFLTEGFLAVPFEEVLAELKDQGKLDPGRPAKIRISQTLIDLYEEDWSPLMKEEIGRLIAREVRRQGRTSKGSPVRLALREDDIIALGELFGARYVVRGRITEYLVRREETLNPFKIGFLTAQNRLLARLFYGAPESGGYGTAQEVSVGGILAAIVGSNAKDPFEPPHKETVRVGHPLFGETFTRYTGGTEDYDLANALSWGAAGMIVSYLAAHGGNAPEAVVGLSLYVYDVEKKALVWENRVRLRVSPQSAWAPRNRVDLLLQAVEAAARELAARFGADMGFVKLAALTAPPEKAPR